MISVLKEIICSSCGTDMKLYGVYDSGEWKFYCPKCNKILNKYEFIQYIKDHEDDEL